VCEVFSAKEITSNPSHVSRKSFQSENNTTTAGLDSNNNHEPSIGQTLEDTKDIKEPSIPTETLSSPHTHTNSDFANVRKSPTKTNGNALPLKKIQSNPEESSVRKRSNKNNSITPTPTSTTSSNLKKRKSGDSVRKKSYSKTIKRLAKPYGDLTTLKKLKRDVMKGKKTSGDKMKHKKSIGGTPSTSTDEINWTESICDVELSNGIEEILQTLNVNERERLEKEIKEQLIVQHHQNEKEVTELQNEMLEKMSEMNRERKQLEEEKRRLHGEWINFKSKLLLDKKYLREEKHKLEKVKKTTKSSTKKIIS